MIAYVARRLLAIVGILLVMSILIFGITQILPGNVAAIVAGQFATDDVIAAVEERLGLNDPAPIQYLRWISGVVVGDFGQSIVMERPVGPLIADALAASAVLAIASLFLVAVFGILFGVISAINENKPADHAISTFTYLGISVPEFFWGIVMIIVFRALPQPLPFWRHRRALRGHPCLGEPSGPSDPDADLHAHRPCLPPHTFQHDRGDGLSNYVRNARAKGLPERDVIFRHALRNALLPTITVLAVDVGWLIGGIVVVETVFSYPGLGRLLVVAIERQDLPLIQASILLIAAIYGIANLAADLLYAFFNPRIRYG